MPKPRAPPTADPIIGTQLAAALTVVRTPIAFSVANTTSLVTARPMNCDPTLPASMNICCLTCSSRASICSGSSPKALFIFGSSSRSKPISAAIPGAAPGIAEAAPAVSARVVTIFLQRSRAWSSCSRVSIFMPSPDNRLHGVAYPFARVNRLAALILIGRPSSWCVTGFCR